MNRTRVESFSDGIFAIAITLLVLSIAEPATGDYRHLAHTLTSSWPSLAAYVVSFAVIGIMWVNHHAVFTRLGRIDRGLVYLNMALLMTIAFLPYPTGVFGQALKEGHGARTAAVFYSITMAVNSYTWVALWIYASHRRRLLRPEFPEERRREATIAFNAGSVVYTAAVGIAWVSPYAALAFQGALAVYYALDPLSRRADPGPAASGTGEEAAGPAAADPE
jgi:uncharacterized membrane protein